MLIRLFFFMVSLSATFEEKFWKWWYQRLAAVYPKMDWRFMNYGYAPLDQESSLVLKKEDEENRLFIQLYQHVLSGVELKGKEVLEVGSGRGGGSDYVARYHEPASMIGVDLAQNAVELSNQFYHEPNLKFIEGNAEKLPFENDRFDVVFNVESSHCYGNMQAFLAEVLRVLKPGGVFAWADLRTQKMMEKENELFMHTPFKLLFKEDITANVLHALDLISDEKTKLIKARVSYLWRPLFSEFAGVRDSQAYRSFQARKMVYRCYRFQK